MHLIFNIWGKLPISVEFRPKSDNTRVAVFKCNVKKVVIIVTGLKPNIFAVNLCDWLFRSLYPCEAFPH